MLGIVHRQARRVEGEERVVVDRVQVRDRAGLGQPIALDDLHASDVAEPAGDLGRHGRGADHHVAHAAPIDAADVGVVEEGDQHRRHGEQHRDALALDEAAAPDRVEPLHEHEAGARVDAAAHEHQPVDVIERQEDQVAVLGRGPRRRDELEVVADEGLVAEQDALRQPGGPARVGQDQQVVPREPRGRWRRGRGVLDQVGEA